MRRVGQAHSLFEQAIEKIPILPSPTPDWRMPISTIMAKPKDVFGAKQQFSAAAASRASPIQRLTYSSLLRCLYDNRKECAAVAGEKALALAPNSMPYRRLGDALAPLPISNVGSPMFS